jgi:hypothetical protein
MPFDADGVYTPASGATTAAPGDVIRSATWNAIFEDISDALSLLGEQLYNTTTVSASPYVPLATDAFLLVNVAGAVAINLPSAASRNGFPLAIKDISGNAHTNTITINRDGTDTIEGATSITITSDWGGWHLYPVTGGWILRP